MSDVSLYFHIPFCTKKCPYCHFYVIPDRLLLKKVFVEAIALEWQQRCSLLQDKRVVSIYFGGGTPTLFAPEGIAMLLDLIRNDSIELAEDCEITIEANPEATGKGLFKALHSLGVHRISLGVQSFDDSSLATLERGHAAASAKAAIFEAYTAGIQNISIDLMYDVPDQTEMSWQSTLDQIHSLPITHVSLYNLTIEPHTSFYKRRNSLSLPDQEMSLKLLQLAVSKLDQLGLKRYEISAFAREGFQSRHNTGYWLGRPFLGFGPSAFSYWEGERFRNIGHLQRYARYLREGQSPIDFREKLPYPRNVKELFLIQLRMLSGVDLQKFPPLPAETIFALEKWIGEGALKREGHLIYLTDRGTYFYDSIATDLS